MGRSTAATYRQQTLSSPPSSACDRLRIRLNEERNQRSKPVHRIGSGPHAGSLERPALDRGGSKEPPYDWPARPRTLVGRLFRGAAARLTHFGGRVFRPAGARRVFRKTCPTRWRLSKEPPYDRQ